MKLSQTSIEAEVKVMRIVPMIALAVLFATFGAFKTPTASAQTKTCRLALEVVTYKNSQIKLVTGARATALNTSNRKSTAAVSWNGQLRFSELAEGEYRISITKSGFKRAIQPVSFKCEAMNAEAAMQVDLDPGNFRRSVVAKSESVVASSQSTIPPVRRGVTTVLGTSDNASALKPGEQSAPPPVRLNGTPISGGVLNGKAISLPKPVYPPIARQAHASGVVAVQVVIDEVGNVISAHAVSGHPLLQAVCVKAARDAKFSATKLAGQPVKVTGIITYNFVAE